MSIEKIVIITAKVHDILIETLQAKRIYSNVSSWNNL